MTPFIQVTNNYYNLKEIYYLLKEFKIKYKCLTLLGSTISNKIINILMAL